jgi:hypothetical protein
MTTHRLRMCCVGENPDVIDLLLYRAEVIFRNPKVAVILLAATVLFAALTGWTAAETVAELIFEWDMGELL